VSKYFLKLSLKGKILVSVDNDPQDYKLSCYGNFHIVSCFIHLDYLNLAMDGKTVPTVHTSFFFE
jgi:hypothetical protein